MIIGIKRTPDGAAFAIIASCTLHQIIGLDMGTDAVEILGLYGLVVVVCE